jgi:cyclophilin family peptidyl-prolyl cis-trans isomerase
MYKAFMIISVAAAFIAVAAIPLQAANPRVLMKTSKGDITIELFQDKAPLSVKNFLSYVEDRYYDGLIFHRVIKGFMIQGGGMTPDMHEKSSKPPIKNEASNRVNNDRGTLAMARTMDIDSATCQFFINLVANDFLNHVPNDPEKFGYAVFGKVAAGMDVVDAIASVPTGTKSGHRDVPREPVTILSVTRIPAK